MMKYSQATVAAVLVSAVGVSAFNTPPAFGVSKHVASVNRAGDANHQKSCGCNTCSSFTILFADAVAEDVPAEVEAMDGIESNEEAHNAERPARKSISKKGPKGKPLSEFSVGSSVKGTVRAIASYGAFLDIGAETDGLLHVSQLSTEFVADVSSVLEVGSEYDVRIVNIDEGKKQVALSLLTAEEAEKAKPQGPRRERPQRQQRPDDSAVLAALTEKGWDKDQFVEGTVVSTVDFGAFVRINAADLNSEVEGQMDGLVHISSLAAGRVSSVTSVVQADQKVQVRVKEIANKKVSLTMVSVEDEEAQRAARAASDVGPGNPNWKEDMGKIEMPAFKNGPIVVDMRK